MENIITNKADDLRKADRIILPGVGAFPAAMNMLNNSGLVPLIHEQTKIKPFLGICLGMQLIFEKGYEFEECDGLGLIPGAVKKIERTDMPIPHMGWNQVKDVRGHFLFKDIPDLTDFYFVHSYYAEPSKEEHILGTTSYGKDFACVIGNEQVMGVQFHPEKSGKYGIQLLDNYCKQGVMRDA